MYFLEKFGFILFCTSYMPLLIYCQETCVKRSPCSCVYPNGTGIDLAPSATTTFLSAQSYSEKMNGTQYELSTYFYHPCIDILPKNYNIVNTTCDLPLSVCRHVNTMVLEDKTNNTYKLDSGVCDFMGSSNDSEIGVNGDSIIYKNGPSSTIVLLICAKSDDKLHIYSLEDPRKIVLSFYSRNACLTQIEEVGRSAGSTLLIIFFSLVVFYLVLGICTKKFLMGATGLEVIPNLGFWSDLPNLVKDGWAFAISGFRLPSRGAGPATSPDPNSYDSI